MKKTVVLYPGLAVSHFVPMMQLADVLLDAGYAVVVALIDPADKQDIAFAAVVRRVAASKPRVAFHKLPRIEDPPTVIHDDAQFLLRYLDLVSRYDQLLHGFLCAMPLGSVQAVVVDVLSMGALDVAKKLGIPAYSFDATNASAVAVFLQLPTIRREDQPSFRELGDTPLNFHGVPPMPASHLVEQVLQDPESEVYKVMMDGFRRIPEVVDGILVNTFASLETRAVEALGDLRHLPAAPPVYCVGPLLAEAGKEKEKHECLSWLDEQPERSVVYLCFGSIGTGNHSREQLKEIALGLENSGHRFLWVVRAPPSDDPERPSDPRADPDLDKLLPDGFLDRTNGRGLILKLWAPQVDVLRHKATGAFVTHCGWNSVLEGITAGVPMLCWPLYAEQKMNKVFMVEEAGIGVEVAGWQQGLVKAGEVEAKVRMVLESEEGERLRAQVTSLSKAAAAAWEDGGSSRVAFQRFLSDAEKLKAQAMRG